MQFKRSFGFGVGMAIASLLHYLAIGLHKKIILTFPFLKNFVLPLLIVVIQGSMPEWLMGADCKSAGYAYVGSNPTRPTTHSYDYILTIKDRVSISYLIFKFPILVALVAQW